MDQIKIPMNGSTDETLISSLLEGKKAAIFTNVASAWGLT